MRGKQTAGMICLVLAAAFLISGISTILRDPQATEASGLGVSRAVGALLPSLVAAIVGLLLLRKKNA